MDGRGSTERERGAGIEAAVTRSDAGVDIDLRAWRPDDLGLMTRLLGDPAMTRYLGGPESPERLQSRLTRYLEDGPGRMFVITVGPERLDAGTVGYWPHDVDGEPALETGWSVLPELQGRGIATRAAGRCLQLAAAVGGYRTIHAYPSIDNGASNAVCRKLGFELRGQAAFEYPKGHWMTCNDWSFDLVARLGART